jgi:hypothetical protein
MAFRSDLSATTFKPQIDKWTAQDGSAVVLWADPDEALILRYSAARWEVTRHPAVEAAELPSDAPMDWLGVPYAGAGERIAEFTPDSTDSDWDRFYASCQRRQRQRSRNLLVSC